MPTFEIGLVDLGERLPISLKQLATKLNGLQETFRFTVLGPVTSASLGPPDIFDEWYSSETLLRTLQQHPRPAEVHQVVGVTRARFTEPAYLLRQTPVKSYFSLSDGGSTSVISLDREMLVFNSEGKDAYQYTAFLIACELLNTLAGHDLSHNRRDQCLFDDCENRSDFAECIDRADICHLCRADLARANVGSEVVDDALRILRWCRRNAVGFAARLTLHHPLTALSVGASLGWAMSILLPSSAVPVVAVLALAVPLLVFAHSRYRV